ncbi:MAG TPA: DUF4062 domain-containing protein [Blastocatellia bacterium]|nr:DUF4062 domain-containing protein [Blastocatellia bacterium]
MAEKTPTVAISVTPDLVEYRNLILILCQEMGLQPVVTDMFFAIEGTLSPVIDEADIYLGIIGREYGPVLGSSAISRVEMEYNQAARRGIPCFIFMMEEAA